MHGAGPSSWPPAAMNSDPVEKQSVYCYATHYYLVPVLWDRTSPPKLNPRGENHLRACFESPTNRQIFVPIRRVAHPTWSQNRSLSLIAAQAGIPCSTIHRCLNRYRRFALAVLAREPREDRGKRLALSPGLLEIAEALALEAPPPPQIAAIYRRGICQVAQDRILAAWFRAMVLFMCLRKGLGN